MSQPFRVRDFMAASLVTFSPDTPILDAVHVLLERRISGAPVVDARGNLVGILSERDCLRVVVTASYHGEPGGRVGEFMSRDVETVPVDASLFEVAERFLAAPFRRYPVLDAANRLVGQISRRDVLRALQRRA